MSIDENKYSDLIDAGLSEKEKLINKLEKLQAQLDSARNCIVFYGDKETYKRNHYNDIAREIIAGDCDKVDKYAEWCGGKRARNWLENNKQ